MIVIVFLEDPVHFYSDLFALMTVKHNVPFSMHNRDEWRMFMHRVLLNDAGLMRK